VRNLGAVLGILTLPVAIFYLFEVQPYSLYTQVDSFIYTGYSQNLPDLVTRYGFPYYAVRFGLILPTRFAFELFGPVGGYFLLRFLLAASCAAVLYLLGRRHGCPAAGWFGAIIFLSSPILLRALMTDYADTTGLPLLLIGIGCLMMPTRRRLLWAVPAGLAFGVAINSNLFIAAVLLAVLAARLLLQLLRRDFAALLTYLVAGAGIVLVTGLGAFYYWRAFGYANILRPSIAYLRHSSAVSRAFRAPTYAWLDFSLYLYIPVIITIALGITLLTRPVEKSSSRYKSILKSPATDALVLLAAAEGFYLFEEFILKGYQLDYFYYASYLWAFSSIGLTFVIIELAGRRGHGTRIAWLAFTVAVALPLGRNLFFRELAFWAWPAVLFMVAAIAIPLAWPRARAGASQFGVVALVASVILLGLSPPHHVPWSRTQTVRADPHYETAIGSEDQSALDYFEMASQLIKETPKWTDDPGTVLFWYPQRETVIDLIQGTYLWRRNTLQDEGPGLPTLNASQIRELRGRTPRTIMMLVYNRADLGRGRRALLAAGLHPLQIVDGRLHAGRTTVYTEQLTFQPAPCDKERGSDVPWRLLGTTCK
jgi:hypothetical protein